MKTVAALIRLLDRLSELAEVLIALVSEKVEEHRKKKALEEYDKADKKAGETKDSSDLERAWGRKPAPPK